MPDSELVKVLDYILNYSDEYSIEVIAEAVIRRRRDLTIYHATGQLPDPQRMASEITKKINTGLGGSIESMKKSIQEMTVRIIREHAPELTDSQVEELCQAWLPGSEAAKSKKKDALPGNLLLSMIDQFVSFSRGAMNKSVDDNLRQEMGAWPERYWNAFPPVIRSIITDYLKDKISEKDFYSKIGIALDL